MSNQTRVPGLTPAWAAMSCGHCGRIHLQPTDGLVPPGGYAVPEGPYCFDCDQPLCDQCYGQIRLYPAAKGE